MSSLSWLRTIIENTYAKQVDDGVKVASGCENPEAGLGGENWWICWNVKSTNQDKGQDVLQIILLTLKERIAFFPLKYHLITV